MTATKRLVPKAILLARFSPRPGAEECESCEQQLKDLYAAAEQHRWQVVATYQDDAVSGDDWLRPGLWNALANLGPQHVLMVRNLNRLARDTLLGLYISQQIDTKGAQLFSLDDGGLQDNSPVGLFMRTIMFAVANLQKHEAAGRTSRRMREHQAGGRSMSKIPPYGWTRVPEGEGFKLVEHPLEQRVIQEEIIPRFQLNMKLREIARDLDAEKITCRGRAPWRHNTIRSILEREKLLKPRPRRRRGASEFLSHPGGAKS